MPDRQAGTEEGSLDLDPVAMDQSGDLAVIATTAGLELRFLLIKIAQMLVKDDAVPHPPRSHGIH